MESIHQPQHQTDRANTAAVTRERLHVSFMPPGTGKTPSDFLETNCSSLQAGSTQTPVSPSARTQKRGDSGGKAARREGARSLGGAECGEGAGGGLWAPAPLQRSLAPPAPPIKAGAAPPLRGGGCGRGGGGQSGTGRSPASLAEPCRPQGACRGSGCMAAVPRGGRTPRCSCTQRRGGTAASPRCAPQTDRARSREGPQPQSGCAMNQEALAPQTFRIP